MESLNTSEENQVSSHQDEEEEEEEQASEAESETSLVSSESWTREELVLHKKLGLKFFSDHQLTPEPNNLQERRRKSSDGLSSILLASNADQVNGDQREAPVPKPIGRQKKNYLDIFGTNKRNTRSTLRGNGTSLSSAFQ